MLMWSCGTSLRCCGRDWGWVLAIEDGVRDEGEDREERDKGWLEAGGEGVVRCLV
jgi:hypothetical protein